MNLIKSICLISALTMMLCACDLPQSGSATKSRSGLLGGMPTRAADDFLWDNGGDRHIYTGFTQMGTRWLCGRIAKKDGKLWWFNEEGASREGLENSLYEREQNYAGLILKKTDRDTFTYDETEYPDMNEQTKQYYQGLKFVYVGNGELDVYIHNQLSSKFKRTH